MTLPHPVAWRYCPSETFSENILTEDRVKAMSARHDFGHTVEGLYTEDQLKAAVLEEREANAKLAETTTARLRTIESWMNAEPAQPCPIAAAIRSRGE